ncbi:MAG: ribonuclease P protein component [Planctomycetes bacterium]|nr:ribonuclease P protein component [Planctomycetota bacterium]
MAASPRNTLPRSVRIRSRRDFDRAFRGGIRASDRWMTLYVGRNEGLPARLGISVARRFGTAVRRNRMKRLIREAFRTMRHELPPATDWIALPRRGEQATVEQLKASFRDLARRLAGRIPPSQAATP